MDMLVQYILSSVVNIGATIYVLSKLLNVKIDFKNYKTYVTYLSLIVIGILNTLYCIGYIRIIIMTAGILIFNYYLFRNDFKKTLISTFAEQVIALISEIAFIAFIMLIKISSNYVLVDLLGTLVINIIISIIMTIIANFKISSRIYNWMLSITNRINIKILYLAVLIIIIPINILVYSVYAETEVFNIFIANVVFIIIYFFILTVALNEKNQNIKYKTENTLLLQNLNEYEKMLDFQRVANHENKNQLLVIKGMIEKKDKKISEYIEEIVKTSKTDNENLLSKIKKIPSGGLQGIIYQKISLMQEQNIGIDLTIQRETRKFPFDELKTRDTYDLCRCVGIILDNAIDEVIKTEEKEIKISLYMDDGLNIEVSNYFKDIPDLSKMDERGYTTKEKGHGYGLTLLKQIIDENGKLENQKSIIGNVFIQNIKIKM